MALKRLKTILLTRGIVQVEIINTIETYHTQGVFATSILHEFNEIIWINVKT